MTLTGTGSDGRTDLSWSVDGTLRNVQVMRDTDSNPSGRQRIATLGSGARSYSDGAVSNGQPYWYWIKFTDGAGAVGNSNGASATPATGNGGGSGGGGNAGATCANPVGVTLPQVFNGAGDQCRVTSGSISAVNSWNTDLVEINGVAYTNHWSNSLPARINGNYYIHYLGKVPWSHLEVNGSGGSGQDGGGGGGNQNVAVTGVSVAPASVALTVGSTASLSASVQPANATNKTVGWSSSASGVASVNAGGLVTGVAAGTATVTAKTADGGRTASSSITVLAPKDPGNNGGSGLKSLADFPIGVAVNAGNENNSFINSGTASQQQAVVLPQFDQLTAGNIMKMSYLHPSETSFSWGQADELVAFARSHGMSVHGHTLIWHSDYQVPAFMRNYGGDFATLLKTHVQTIVRHFAGQVVSWDVVNEALADNNEATVGNGLRSTVFSQKLGLNFIDQAFTNARAADANVDLFYNDYNIEAGGAKTNNLLALVDGMRSRGVPITGVGFQMHVRVDWPSLATIESSLKAIANRGLKVKISELDVSLKNSYSSLTAAAAEAQKQRYHDIVAAYLRAVPPAQRAGITVWGVWDSDSWIQPDWPLLFDANFQPKPALQGFADALSGK